jgi:hypothetical protein
MRNLSLTVIILLMCAALLAGWASSPAVRHQEYLRPANSAGGDTFPGRFLAAPAYPAGTHPNQVVVGDFNSDGIPDLAAVDLVGGVEILLGNGDGTFQAAVSYPAGTRPYSLAVGDFNRDGKLDLAVADASNNTVNILLGNGDGSFQAPSNFAAGNEPIYVVSADFNKDGKPDLAVVDSNGTPNTTIVVLLGNGDGTFQSPVPYQAGLAPFAMVVADFNNDGTPDLAVTNAGVLSDPGNTVSVLLGNGDGTFQTATSFSVGNQPFDITAADFNGDGNTDLATANFQDNTASVLLGNGDGTFRTASAYPAGGAPHGISAVPFNGSEQIGIAVGGASGTYILLGNGDGTFSPGGSYDPGSGPLTIGDFNRDGKADVAAITANGVAIFLGAGTGDFSGSFDYPSGKTPLSVAAGDFLRDGQLDLAVANLDGNNISILLSDGAGHFQQPVRYKGGAHPAGIAVGDLNNDGILDLAVANSPPNKNGTVTVLLGNGSGGFKAVGQYAVDNTPLAVTVADFNHDGNLDLAVANLCGNDESCDGAGTVTILLGTGNGLFATGVDYPAGSAAYVAVGDFNGDGNVDLAVANRLGANGGAGGVGIMLGNGDGTFQPAVNYPAGDEPNYVAVGDFNGDGKLDLAVANSGADNVSILLGNGDGTFGAPANFQVGNGPVEVSTADFNGDGKLDLAVANTNDNSVSLLLGNGDGTFQAPVNFGVGGGPHTVVVGDFHGGGAPDIAVAESSQNTVGILINTGGTNVEVVSSSNPSQYGQPVTFLFVTQARLRDLGYPTGQITLDDGKKPLATIALVNGRGSYMTSTLKAGTHNIRAVYSGDAHFNPNRSAILVQKVD